jgi:Cu+-exporting ATPase
MVQTVHISIDGHHKGFFTIRKQYRKGLEKMFMDLKGRYDIQLLSGDNDKEREFLQANYGVKWAVFPINRPSISCIM